MEISVNIGGKKPKKIICSFKVQLKWQPQQKDLKAEINRRKMSAKLQKRKIEIIKFNKENEKKAEKKQTEPQ